jgi:hypothetical protein
MTNGVYYILHVVKFIYELSLGLEDVWGNGGRVPSILNLGIRQRRFIVLPPVKYGPGAG